MNIWAIVIGTVLFTVVAGGLGYFLWLKTRPKKETWNAKVYQLGEGVRPPKIDKKTGQVISDLQLQDLIPYAKDVVEKIVKQPGITIYRLQKINKVCPAVESSFVEHWGEGNNEVSCLLQGDEIFLLKKGFDKVTGTQVVEPISQSKMNLIKGEMAIRKDRLTNNKDILTSITPWIVAAIAMIGLVMLAYVTVSGFIEISENMKDAAQGQCKTVTGGNNNQPNTNNLGQQAEPQPEPVAPEPDIPMVE